MGEVGGPLAEVREHRRLDRLHSFRLLGVVGDAVFRAVGVRDEERALTVVAAAGARRHRLTFTFFLPRRGHESSAPCSGVLARPALRRFFCWLVANFDALFTRCGVVVCLLGANRAPPQLAVCCALRTTTVKVVFLAGVMDANRLLRAYFLWVCAILAALWPTRLALRSSASGRRAPAHPALDERDY